MTKYFKRTPQGLIEVSVIDAQSLRDNEKIIIKEDKQEQQNNENKTTRQRN